MKSKTNTLNRNFFLPIILLLLHFIVPLNKAHAAQDVWITQHPTPTTQTIMAGGTVATYTVAGSYKNGINQTKSASNFQWYSNTVNAISGGTQISGANSSTYTPPSTTVGTKYYWCNVQQTLFGNANTNIAAVTVTATTLPTANNQTFCSAATVANLVATGSSLKWYNVATGGTALVSTTVLNTGTYYVSQTIYGIESARTAVSVSTAVSDFGNALDFNGKNQVNFGTAAYSTITYPFTVEAWVYFKGGYSIKTIINKSADGAGTGGFGLYINNWTTSDQKLVLQTKNTKLISDGIVPINTWTHIAATITSATEAQLFINGISQSVTGSVNYIPNTNVDFTIGSLQNFYKFNGTIDDVRIWSQAKTSNQIQQSMYALPLGNEPNLVGYFNFNQGIAGGDNSGIATLTNNVSGAPNGTLNGFTLTGSVSNFVSAPSFPVSSPFITGIRSTANTADLAFQAPTYAAVAAFTNYEYSLNNGSTWVTPSPAVTTSPLTIKGLTAGTTYNVKLRAVTSSGASCASPTVSATTFNPVVANAPTNLVATAGFNEKAIIEFTAPTNDGGADITAYEYSINDGSSWTSIASVASPANISGLAACTSYSIKIRAVNVAGSGATSAAVSVSPQYGQPVGNLWTIGSSAADNYWNSVTYGNGLFVAVAGSGPGNLVMSSPDGITWTLRTAANANYWTSVTYGNGLFVAVASSGTGNRVMTSTDGISWTIRTSVANNSWSSVTYGKGLFVAVADSGNQVMTSADGITWKGQTVVANSWSSITFGNGLFVAVAASGTGNRVMTSTDGITWTTRASAADNEWSSITYGNGLFVAVASAATQQSQVMTSSDGINWTIRTSAADRSWQSVIYGSGLFVAVGTASSSQSQVMTSSDGINWTATSVQPLSNSWSSVAYGNGKFVAVGNQSGTGSRVMTSSDAFAPNSPSITVITPTFNTASVAFTPPTNDGGAAVTNYEYSLNNGTTWVTPSPAVTASPLTITGLTNGTTYAIQLRAVNSTSSGCGSATVSTTTKENAPANFSYTTPNTFSVGTAITPLSPTAMVISPTFNAARFNAPRGLAVDATGNVYVSDMGKGEIYKVTTNGNTTTLATGLNYPSGVAVDAAGNVYVADQQNSLVIKIATNGTKTTLGSGFRYPKGVAVDAAGNIYVADYGNNAVKKIDPDGTTVTTLGSGFYQPSGVAVDALGNVYVADQGNRLFKKIATDGATVSTLFSGAIKNPYGVTIDATGNVYVSDFDNNSIMKITPDLTSISNYYSIVSPNGVTIDALGSLYVTSNNSAAVAKVPAPVGPVSSYSIAPALPAGVSINSTTGVISGTPTVAINGTTNYTVTASNAGGSKTAVLSINFPNAPANISYTTPNTFSVGTAITPLSPTAMVISPTFNAAPFNAPRGIAVDATGNVYVSDMGVGAVYKVNIGGGSSTFFILQKSTPDGVAVDAAGNVYVAYQQQSYISKIAPDGTFVTALGSGFRYPKGVAVDAAGNIYVADYGNNAVKKIAPDGTTVTTLGSGFYQPSGVAVDALGNVYVADQGNRLFKKIATDGATVSTLFSGAIKNPYGVTIDATGNVYVSDFDNNSIMKITPDLTSISNYYSIASPNGVTIDALGSLYVTSNNSAAVAKVPAPVGPVSSYSISPALPAGVSINSTTGVISGTPTTVTAAATYTVTASNGGGSKTAVLSINFPNAPANISYSTPNTYTVGRAITPLSPTAVVPGITAIGSGFNDPYGVAIDAAGNVYVADTGNNAVKKIDINGTITSLGSGFSYPTGVAVDATGNVYVADFTNGAIKKIASDGITVTTIASDEIFPFGVAIDAIGNLYYSNYDSVKEIAVNGNKITIGSGFNQPNGVSVDAAGNVYVAEKLNNAIKKIAINGTVTTLGSGFNQPRGVAVDAAGNVYVADFANHAIKKIAPDGTTVSTISSPVYNASGVAVDALGNVYLSSINGDYVKKIPAPAGPVSSYSITPTLPAGLSFNTTTGVISGTPTVSTGATSYTVTASNGGGSKTAVVTIGVICTPDNSTTSLHINTTALPYSWNGLTFTAAGTQTAHLTNAYGCDNEATLNLTVFTVAPDSISYTTPPTFKVGSAISPISPTATVPGISTIYSGDFQPGQLAVDSADNVYAVSNGNNSHVTQAVLKIATNGTTTLIGNGLSQPHQVAVDGVGNVYVGDQNDKAVNKIAVNGTITRLLSSTIIQPFGVAVDAIGNVYVADRGTRSILKIATNGTLTTLASTGFSYPSEVAVDANGYVYMTLYASNLIKKIAPNGSTVTTIGSGFNSPSGVASDAAGNVYVSDLRNKDIKKIAINGTITTLASFSDSPVGLAVNATGTVYVSLNTLGGIQKIPVAGGTVSSYSIAPALPAGLSIDTVTGVISGTPTVATAATDYTVTATNAGGSVTAVLSITAIPVVDAPTAAAQTFCNGATAANLVATGTDLQWYDVAIGGTALTTSTAIATSTYYVSQTVNGVESERTAVAITINTTAAPTAFAQTFCSGTEATVANLSAGGLGGFMWYSALTAGTALATSTVLATGTYYVSQTGPGVSGSCESARTAAVVTVNTTLPPAAAAQSFCSGATVANLVASQTISARLLVATLLKWYSTSIGGTALASTTPLTSGTYYVSKTVASCESGRTAVAVTVNNTAAPTTSASQTFCNGATIANLVATGTDLKWYGAATGGTALVPSMTLFNGTYYVSQTISGCESARTTVAVTLTFTPRPPAFAQTFCNEATVINLYADGTALKWYSVATGGTALTTSAVLASGTYYVSQTLLSCESTRTSVAVTVNTTAAPTASAQTFCSGATVANLLATGTALKWYQTQTGGGPGWPAATVLESGTYYVSQTINGCESARTAVAVTVNNTAAPTAADQTFNTSATVADLIATGTALQWYTAATGGSALATSTALATGPYYVSQTLNGCESERTTVAVTIITTTTINSLQCGTTLAALNSTISCDPINASSYTFKIVTSGSNAIRYYISSTASFNLTQVPGTLYNTTYTLSVAPTIGGVLKDYSSGCTLTTPPLPTTIQDSQCGQILPTLGTSIYANYVSGATNYRFKVVANGVEKSIETVIRVFQLTSLLSDALFNSTYTISVATKYNGVWGDYGTACIVRTPTEVTAIQDTTIQDSQCGQILPTLGTSIYAKYVTGATNYRFKVVANGIDRTIETVSRSFQLTSLLSDALFNSAYTISVATKYNGVWGDYGTACIVRTPTEVTTIQDTKIQDSQCGQVLPTLGTSIYANYVAGATNYRFKVVANGVERTIDKTSRVFQLTSLSGGALNNTAYAISVATKYNGVWGDYGTACIVRTPTVVTTIQYTTIQDSQCGQILPTLGTSIYANYVEEATNYRFKVVANGVERTIDKTSRDFQLTSLLSDALFNSAYTISVATKYNGVWGDYGTACIVRTPTVVTAIQDTTIQDSQCGQILPTLGTSIYANIVAGATNYRFKVVANGIDRTIETVSGSFQLTSLFSDALFNSAYTISVATKYNGVWGDYGTACIVRTPTEVTTIQDTKIQDSQCGQILPTLGTSIYANIVAGATNYRFKVVANGIDRTIDKTSRDFQLTSLLSDALFNSAYTISVATKYNGVWGDYGTACIIRTPMVVTTIQDTTIQDSQCGQILPTLGTSIYANYVAGATNYRFKVVANGVEKSIETVNRVFQLTSLLSDALFDSAYTISVATKYNGVWGDYGTACIIRTPMVVNTIQDTTIQDSQCGQILPTLGTSIYANHVAGATNYRFKVVANGVERTIDKTSRVFQLTSLLSDALFNSAYTISVATKYNGVWGDYGTACIIRTPTVVTTIQDTKIQDSQCGQILPTLGTSIYANYVAGATNYRFKVVANGVERTIETVNRVFQLTSLLSDALFNSAYTISVATKYNGVWGDYGNECTVRTPTVVTAIQDSQCGQILPTLGTSIYANYVAGATNYRFKVVANGVERTIDKTSRDFQLTSLLSGALFNTAYTINVATKYNGVWGDYGTACILRTPTGLTTIQDSQCGQILPTLGTSIYANYVAGATNYRFKVVANGVERTIETVSRVFQLTSLSGGAVNNTTYTISVATKYNGFWGDYGTACILRTPTGLTAIQDSQCGQILPTLGTSIYANYVTGATNYRFKVVANGVERTIDKTSRDFQLTFLLSDALFNSAYTISVATKYNGVWGDYGTACIVRTPTEVTTIQDTTIQDSQCGQILPTLGTSIYANYVAGATNYRFKVVANGVERTIETVNRVFQLTSLLSDALFNSAYTISVATKYNGVWGDYGTACIVRTPTVVTAIQDTTIQDSQCGQVLLTLGTSIYANYIAGATNYRFKVVANGVERTIDKTSRVFQLTSLSGGALNNTAYTISVATKYNGVWGDYGTACIVRTPSTITAKVSKPVTTAVAKEKVLDQTSVLAYPSPFATNFNLTITSLSNADIQVRVYDMTGKLIESRKSGVSEIQSVELGSYYPSGVYNVIVSQGENTNTLRVIKK